MTRIDMAMDWCRLEEIAAAGGYKIVYRVARCEHGKMRDQTCRDCEGGYVQDTHTYANIGAYKVLDGQALVAVSDDGDSVAYVPSGR